MARATSMRGMSAELKQMRSEVRKQTRQMMRQLAVETAVTAKGLFGHYQEGKVEWDKLSPYTLRQAKRQRQLAQNGRSGDSPLLVTGELRDSVQYANGADWAAAGTNSEIMVLQEFGGPNPMQGAADIPPRPVFEPTAYIMYDKLPEAVKKNFNVVFKSGKGSMAVSSGIGNSSSGGDVESDEDMYGGDY